eukprot:TRINITY_DN7141_c0_g1_i2.p1 TRINITY_DN7141_c0_g1~~TRINITY_DN7141_c0_g1_i2.p1  ORF type:complete len:257 (-),score=43.65 TRINITY_DN7141_c0_g1_i2:8-778(-)
MSATEALYWADSYHFEDDAKVLAVEHNIVEEKGKRSELIAVILDRTLFYPQGGGQPADGGELTGMNGKFVVKDVRMNKDGRIQHIGSFEGSDFKEGEVVHMKIDEAKRRQHAKLHSAGHLLDTALGNIGETELEPGKGYHFPNGAYVEYKGSIAAEKRDEVKRRLEEEMARLIKEGSKVQVEMTDYDKIASKLSDKWGVPSYLPSDRPARIVTVAGKFGCPCGGTHVKDAREIGSIKIRKLVVKGGTTRISYDIEN